MEIINCIRIDGRVIMAAKGDNVRVCDGENHCFETFITEIGKDVVLEKSQGGSLSIPVDSFRRGHSGDLTFEPRPYHPKDDPDPLIQEALRILKEEKP